MGRKQCKEAGCRKLIWNEEDDWLFCYDHISYRCIKCNKLKVKPDSDDFICWECSQPRCEVDGCNDRICKGSTSCWNHSTTACPNSWCDKRVSGNYKQCFDCHKYDNSISNKYGITLEQVVMMYDSQGGKCDISGCHEPIEFSWAPRSRGAVGHIDHCHTNKHVRGLLCHSCNKGLGMFKDNVSRMCGAAEYLIRTSK